MNEIERTCVNTCPKYLLCAKMYNTGLSHLILATSTNGMEEYEAEDGRLISAAEFYGTENMSEEEIEQHYAAGTSLRDGGMMLKKQLLEGCSAGAPTRLPGGYEMCESTNRNEVQFTEEDLK